MLADWLGCGAWSAECVTLSQPSSEQGTAQELDLVFSSPRLPAGPGVSDGELGAGSLRGGGVDFALSRNPG